MKEHTRGENALKLRRHSYFTREFTLELGAKHKSQRAWTRLIVTTRARKLCGNRLNTRPGERQISTEGGTINPRLVENYYVARSPVEDARHEVQACPTDTLLFTQLVPIGSDSLGRNLLFRFRLAPMISD